MLKGDSLESLWLKIIEYVWNNGKVVITTDNEILVVKNLIFSYSNPYLTEVKKYKKHIPGNYISNIKKIYAKD